MSAPKKRGLGRGLEALLGPKAADTATPEVQPGERLRQLPVLKGAEIHGAVLQPQGKALRRGGMNLHGQKLGTRRRIGSNNARFHGKARDRLILII